MKRNRTIQYTIRGVEPDVDKMLRNRSRSEGLSLNETALRALRSYAGRAESAEHHDLDDLVGSWVEDPAFDEAIEEQRRIDEDLWR